MIAIINKTDVVLSKEEYTEYLEYRKQADKEAEEWDENICNCHCTCGEVEYDIEDAETDIDTLFDITDDLQGEIRFNRNIQRLVNKTFREEIQEIKDGMDRLVKGQERSAGSKRVDDKKTYSKTARRSVDGVEKGKR